jgi:hypothetical protein
MKMAPSVFLSNPIVEGSHIEIIGGKYQGHFALVTGFTPTGQCRILLDHGSQAKPGAIATKNLKTRCARHNAQLVQAKLVQDDPSYVGIEAYDDSSVKVLEDRWHSMELVLLAKLVSLQLADSNLDIQDKKVVRFLGLLHTSLSNQS